MPESYNLLQPTPQNDAPANTEKPDVATASLNLMQSSETPVAEKVGFDLNLGGKSTSTGSESSLSMANNQDSIIEGIVRQATDTHSDEQQVLGDLEQMNTNLELSLPVSSDESKQKFAKLFFVVSLVAALIAFLLYSGLLNNTFLAFTKIDFVSESEQKLVSTQAEKIVNNYALAALSLDSLAVQSSKLNYALKYNPEDALRYKKDMQFSLATIRTTLLDSQKEIILNENLPSEVLLNINDQKQNYTNLLAKETDPAKKIDFKNLEQLYFTAGKLSRNQELANLLKTKKIDELSEAELLALAEMVIDQGSLSRIGNIAKVELSRVNWTTIFSEFEDIITTFDPNFNVFTQNEDYIVSFSSYTLNSATGLISAQGEVKTDNSKTFTLIADLMDKLEESPEFKDLNYTSFTKSFTEDSGAFNSSLNLSFFLESRDLINQQQT
jgi:Asp-tRNA(Asn)/Glu-tRNA(Gln) amidotransferase C subunit